jgi:hypothetical protein
VVPVIGPDQRYFGFAEYGIDTNFGGGYRLGEYIHCDGGDAYEGELVHNDNPSERTANICSGGLLRREPLHNSRPPS